MGDNTAPKFTQKPSLKQEGSAIVFHCEIEAAPEPSVTWFKGATQLQDTDRLKASVTKVNTGVNRYSLKLVVDNVSPEDSGTYKVEAKNKLGQMSANINLNLQGQCVSSSLSPASHE